MPAYYKLRRKRVFRRKPRVARKKPFIKRKSVIPRGMRQAVIPMTREKTIFLNSMSALPANFAYGQSTGYNTIQCSENFTMNMLPDITELTNVFKTYKLNCVIVTIQNLHNSSQYTSGSSQNYYGGNLICYAQKNRTASPLDTYITQDYWDQQQAKITKLITGGRTTVFKVYPKQLVNTAITGATHTNVQRSATWTSTNTTGLSVPHYGLNYQFSLTDPTLAFNNSVVTANPPAAPINLRITYKYLFQLRGVH